MHEKIVKGKVTEYNPPVFLRTIKEKKYYPYFISIPSTDFNNEQKRIFSFLYKYKLGDLMGFHPFTKDKSPPYCKDIDKDKKNCFAKFYQLFKNEINSEIFESYFCDFFSVDEYKDDKKLDDFPFLLSILDSELKDVKLTPILDDIIISFKYFEWNKKYNWESDFPKAEEHLYNDFIAPLFLGNSENYKAVYSNLD